MSSIIRTSHLTFKYSENSKTVIDDVSFQIEEGSFVSIVGQNGSGKTTLVKILSDIIQPTDGTVAKNFDFSALVFQNPENQFVSNIVEEDVAFGPENLCFPSEKIRKVVDDALFSVDMYEEKNRPISSLSGGEKQLVAIAGALALSSDCIILDEPTSMLGSEDSKRVINNILKLNREKKITIICVTQNPNMALASDRILIMEKGKIVSDVTPDEFVVNYEKYESSGIVLPEHIKLARLLNERGAGIDIKNVNVEGIMEAVQKLC